MKLLWIGLAEIKKLRGRLGAKWCVVVLLLPVVGFGIAHFGWRAALVLLVSLLVSILGGIFPRALARERFKVFHDGTFVTALLLALSMGAGTPVYMVIAGALVASIAGKWQVLGRNWLNPAALGRAAVGVLEWFFPPWQSGQQVDISTGASALPLTHGGVPQPAWLDLFLGFTQGAIGETSAALLIAVGALLLWLVALKREAALAMIFATPVLVALMPATAQSVGHAPWAHNPVYYLFGGGTMLMALFFATDPVTTPKTRLGGVMFGLGVAGLGVTLKLTWAVPGAEMWGVLAMNLLVPLLDKLARLGGSTKIPEGCELPQTKLPAMPDSRRVTLTLDGRRVETRGDQTLLELARAHGAFVPTLCYLGREKAPSACRLCLVQVEGSSKLINACDTPIAAGMVVDTTSDAVIQARRRVMQGLLRMHGLCGDPGCEVERQAARLGVAWDNTAPPTVLGLRALTEHLVEQQDLCVRCNRCVASCGERGAIVMQKIGPERLMHIDPAKCTDCGDCLNICPSNALARS